MRIIANASELIILFVVIVKFFEVRKLGLDEFQNSLSQYERFEEDIAGEIRHSMRSDMMKA